MCGIAVNGLQKFHKFSYDCAQFIWTIAVEVLTFVCYNVSLVETLNIKINLLKERRYRYDKN